MGEAGRAHPLTKRRRRSRTEGRGRARSEFAAAGTSFLLKRLTGLRRYGKTPIERVAFAASSVRRPKRDYYEVLGVPETADGEQISRAFRRLARDLHPDVSDSPAAEERFREVSAAYSALSKPRSRFLYDRFGFRGRGAGFEDGHFPGAPSVLGEVELEQYEAARGVRREVQIVDADLCRTCDGSGAAPGTEVRTCERWARGRTGVVGSRCRPVAEGRAVPGVRRRRAVPDPLSGLWRAWGGGHRAHDQGAHSCGC